MEENGYAVFFLQTLAEVTAGWSVVGCEAFILHRRSTRRALIEVAWQVGRVKCWDLPIDHADHGHCDVGAIQSDGQERAACEQGDVKSDGFQPPEACGVHVELTIKKWRI